jgi:acetylornithine deacetylase/succinyl-diaminopimelate desuccinylase-like protein
MAADTAPQVAAEAILAHLDRDYLVETASRLAQVPTDVPLGFDTLIEPDDPKLVHYVQHYVRPELTGLGYFDLIDAGRNNLVARLGPGGTGRALLLMNYTPAQHFNLMDDPFSGRIASAKAWGTDEPCVFGQGVSQNKGHQAVMLAVLKALRASEVELPGRLYWAVNNEGRSSHLSTELIIGSLDEKPSFGLLQIGTGLKISLGNRGRVDVKVHVKGKASHSSRPDLGLSAIDAAAEVVQRLKSVSWSDRHPILGGRHCIVYKIRYEPQAPHTLPSDAYITVDRRLLPGDNPATAVDEVKGALGDMAPYEVEIEQDVYMLPALVEPDHPGVRSLQAANRVVRGAEAETLHGQGTYDAGGPCSLGVPSVMYGASGGAGYPTGTDFVAISALETEARVLTHLITSYLAG